MFCLASFSAQTIAGWNRSCSQLQTVKDKVVRPDSKSQIQRFEADNLTTWSMRHSGVTLKGNRHCWMMPGYMYMCVVCFVMSRQHAPCLGYSRRTIGKIWCTCKTKFNATVRILSRTLPCLSCSCICKIQIHLRYTSTGSTAPIEELTNSDIGLSSLASA